MVEGDIASSIRCMLWLCSRSCNLMLHLILYDLLEIVLPTFSCFHRYLGIKPKISALAGSLKKTSRILN